jgi:hypothetical protein
MVALGNKRQFWLYDIAVAAGMLAGEFAGAI